ncbi:MAG: 3-dehydroquinate dehydratase [Campylobacterota bacterium]|nr:3-dehydroquinate dehydratase [Campylobacterota bacterium]
MKFFNRGLYALILTILFQSQLVAEYLYKDEVIHNPSFNEEVEKLGSELYEKTGISLRLIMLRELPNGKSIVDYEQEVLQELDGPNILLTFSELDSQIDIMANDSSLYEYFDRKQVLSPVASPVQAFTMALFYSDSWESFKATATNSGGTIIPLLAGKAKKGNQIGKYSGSMFNGYADIAEQIAESKGVELENAVGNANQISILILKIVFYGIILIAIYMYIKRRLYLRRQKIEHE